MLELAALYGERDRVNAESGVYVCGVYLYIVDAQTELSDGRYKVLEVVLMLELKVDFKVV